jgi:hypothetical protein
METADTVGKERFLWLPNSLILSHWQQSNQWQLKEVRVKAAVMAACSQERNVFV